MRFPWPSRRPGGRRPNLTLNADSILQGSAGGGWGAMSGSMGCGSGSAGRPADVGWLRCGGVVCGASMIGYAKRLLLDDCLCCE